MENTQERLKRIEKNARTDYVELDEITTIERVDWLREGDFYFLLNQAKTLSAITKCWVDIETNGTTEDADNFYSIVQDILSESIR